LHSDEEDDFSDEIRIEDVENNFETLEEQIEDEAFRQDQGIRNIIL